MGAMIATIERGVLHWQARLLEPTRGPDRFIPQGTYPSDDLLMQLALERELREIYPEAEMVSEKDFSIALATALSVGLDALIEMARAHSYQCYMEGQQLHVMRAKTATWPSTLGVFSFTITGIYTAIAWLREETETS